MNFRSLNTGNLTKCDKTIFRTAQKKSNKQVQTDERKEKRKKEASKQTKNRNKEQNEKREREREKKEKEKRERQKHVSFADEPVEQNDITHTRVSHDTKMKSAGLRFFCHISQLTHPCF